MFAPVKTLSELTFPVDIAAVSVLEVEMFAKVVTES